MIKCKNKSNPFTMHSCIVNSSTWISTVLKIFITYNSTCLHTLWIWIRFSIILKFPKIYPRRKKTAGVSRRWDRVSGRFAALRALPDRHLGRGLNKSLIWNGGHSFIIPFIYVFFFLHLPKNFTMSPFFCALAFFVSCEFII